MTFRGYGAVISYISFNKCENVMDLMRFCAVDFVYYGNSVLG